MLALESAASAHGALLDYADCRLTIYRDFQVECERHVPSYHPQKRIFSDTLEAPLRFFSEELL